MPNEPKKCNYCNKLVDKYVECHICENIICIDCKKKENFTECEICGEQTCERCMNACTRIYLILNISKEQYDKEKRDSIMYICRKCCHKEKDLSYFRCKECHYRDLK